MASDSRPDKRLLQRLVAKRAGSMPSPIRGPLGAKNPFFTAKVQTYPGMGKQVVPEPVNPWREHRPVPPLPRAKITPPLSRAQTKSAPPSQTEPRVQHSQAAVPTPIRIARGSIPNPVEYVTQGFSVIEREFFSAGEELEAATHQELRDGHERAEQARWWQRLAWRVSY